MPTMTAAERRELERFEYNAYIAECPTRQLVDTLGDKWVTLVLCALADGPAALHASSPAGSRA